MDDAAEPGSFHRRMQSVHVPNITSGDLPSFLGLPHLIEGYDLPVGFFETHAHRIAD